MINFLVLVFLYTVSLTDLNSLKVSSVLLRFNLTYVCWFGMAKINGPHKTGIL